MSQKINIYSDAWVEMIFENKNQDYGAFELRKASSKRHLIAVISATIFFALAVSSPMIIKSIIREEKSKNVEVTNLAKIDLDKPKQEEEKVIAEPPPPPLKSSIKFVPPVIKPDDEVSDEDQPKTMEELTKSSLTVSVADIKGTDEENGVDISELNENQNITEEAAEKVWNFVEQPAGFPGGEGELNTYLTKNIKYPELAKESNISGIVYLSFVVNKNGKISQVKLLRGIGGGCDEEAIRVVKEMPSWLPGKQNGEAVNSTFNMPIKFVLQN